MKSSGPFRLFRVPKSDVFRLLVMPGKVVALDQGLESEVPDRAVEAEALDQVREAEVPSAVEVFPALAVQVSVSPLGGDPCLDCLSVVAHILTALLIFCGRTIEFQLHPDQRQYQQKHDSISHN